MKYLSLFSGIEAASVAWEPLGWEPMAFAEFEAFPSAVLAHHFPATPNLGDVTAVDWEQWLTDNGRPDVMVAGSPCQAFSVAGQRRSLDDARGNLALFTAELVRYLNPRVYVWENVPGVLSTKDNAFGALLGELSGAGAALVPPRNGKWSNAGMVVGPERRLAWRVLDAQWFGVAQRRRRVFLVASATDGPDPQQILFEPESVRRHTPPSREPREGTATAAESGAGSGCALAISDVVHGDKSCNGKGWNDTDVAYTLDTMATQGVQPTVMAYKFDSLSSNSMKSSNPHSGVHLEQVSCTVDTTNPCPSKNQGGMAILEPIVMAPAFSKRPGQQIANRSDGLSYAVTTGAPPSVLPTVIDRAAYNQGENAAFDPYIAQTEVMPSLVARGPHAVQEPTCLASGCAHAERTVGYSPTLTTLHDGPPIVATSTVRRLTPCECSRLQGFPDDWARIPWRGKAAEDCPDGPQYKAYGNSMAVPVMAWLGSRINAATGGELTADIPSRYAAEIEYR